MWPFNRRKKPQRRNYAGASINRLTSDWVSSGTSADAEVKKSKFSTKRRRVGERKSQSDIFNAMSASA